MTCTPSRFWFCFSLVQNHPERVSRLNPELLTEGQLPARRRARLRCQLHLGCGEWGSQDLTWSVASRQLTWKGAEPAVPRVAAHLPLPRGFLPSQGLLAPPWPPGPQRGALRKPAQTPPGFPWWKRPGGAGTVFRGPSSCRARGSSPPVQAVSGGSGLTREKGFLPANP